MQLSVALNQQIWEVIKEQWIAEFSPKSVEEVSITKHVISHNQGNKPFINCLNWKKNSGHFLNAWLRHTRIIKWLYVSNSLGHPKLETSLLTVHGVHGVHGTKPMKSKGVISYQMLKFPWQILLFSYGMCRQVVVDALKNAMLTSVTCWVWWGGRRWRGVRKVYMYVLIQYIEECTFKLTDMYLYIHVYRNMYV